MNNLLFLMTDQQRSDTLDPGSPCETPHLDRLARQGTRFRRCYSTNPVCSPSRASLMTGLLPHSHGMVDVAHAVEPYRAGLKPDLPMWSRRLQQAGYRTAYFGKWHVERSNRLERFGFDTYELVDEEDSGYAAHRRDLDLPPAPRRIEEHALHDAGYRDFLLYGLTDEPPEATAEHYLYSRAIAFLREGSDDGRPWAVFVSTEGPHDPYVVPRSLRARYDAQTLVPPASFDDDMRDKPEIYRRIQQVFRRMGWEEFAEATACYYAFCSLVDDQVGRILDVVDELGQEDSTVVAYTSDHGDYLGAHRMLLKGIAAFEEAYKVPLVLKGPGVAAGQERDEVVSLLDLAATVSRLTAAEDLPCHGRPLTPLLQAGPAEWRDEAFAEFHGQRFSFTQRTLWSGRYKYVFNTFANDELYDLEDDPHELRNLAHDPDAREVARAMAGRMWEIIRDTDDYNMYDAQYGIFRFAPRGPVPGD